MPDVDGAAPAAADSTPAPATVEADVAAPPNPLSVEPQAKEPAPAEDKAPPRKPTTRESLDKAIAKVEAQAVKDAKAGKDAKPAPAKVEAKVEAEPAKAAQTRDQTGKFTPRTPPADGADDADANQHADPAEPKPTRFKDAPARFSPDAKAAWEAAPEPVRAEAHRMVREFEQFHAANKEATQRAERLKPYDDLAKQNGTTTEETLKNYVELRSLLAKSPVAGLERIVNNIGLKRPDGTPITLRDIAGHVLNQKPDAVASRSEARIAQLEARIAEQDKRLGGVTRTMDEQRADHTVERISTWSATPGHERFDDLSDDISFFLQSGRIDKSQPFEDQLQEAYGLAERLNPAAAHAPATEAQTLTRPSADAQTVKGKSISGAPSPGSSPRRGKPAPTTRAALDEAFARLGL